MSGEIMLSDIFLVTLSVVMASKKNSFFSLGIVSIISYDCSFFDKEVKLIVLKQCL